MATKTKSVPTICPPTAHHFVLFDKTPRLFVNGMGGVPPQTPIHALYCVKCGMVKPV